MKSKIQKIVPFIANLVPGMVSNFTSLLLWGEIEYPTED